CPEKGVHITKHVQKAEKIDALCTKINPKHVQKAENAKNAIVRKL
ncbi:hypothetical protein HMPREF1580_00877, partial [Gardnerella vaginalis JCP8070]